MHVNHHGVEYGYELIAAIPYAYWLHEQGKLTGTISNEDTSCLYYFSPLHTESLGERHYKYVKTCIREGRIPNINIHRRDLDWARWSPPPYNDFYKNNEFDYDLVVCNKYNYEWSKPPINFIDISTLDKIFTSNKGRKILYFHMTTEMGRDDTVKSLSLGEFDMVDSHDHVTTMQYVLDKYPYSLNEIQCLIYANCDDYITVQGGSSIFASYFSRQNIIFAKRGNELDVNAYAWYDRFNGSDITVVDNYEDLHEKSVFKN